MAVYRSPLTRNPRATEEEVDDAVRLAENILDLEKGVDSAVKRVQANIQLSDTQKQLIISEIRRLAAGADKAKTPSEQTGFWGKVRNFGEGVVGTVVAPWAPKVIRNKIGETAVDVALTAQRTGMSAIKELSDARVARGLKGLEFPRPMTIIAETNKGKDVGDVLRETVARGTGATPMGAKEKQVLLELAKVTGDDLKPSFKDFAKQAVNPDWGWEKTATQKALEAENPLTGFMSQLGVSVITDPTSYITGVGNVKYVGKAGKLALAQRLSTAEKVALYPQLAGRYNDLVRYGQNAPIEGLREILKAEGIETGVRILGATIKGTDRISTPVGRAISGSWETVSDIITRIVPPIIKFSPRSRAFAVNVGRRATVGGKYRVSETEALRAIANWSARQYARGTVPSQFNRSMSVIRETLNEIRESGRADEISGLLETANPYDPTGSLKFARLDAAAQNWVRALTDWQRQTYSAAEAVYKRFGVEFGSDVPDFSWIDNYVHHRISKAAAVWMRENEETVKRSGWFRTTDLDAAEITDMATPMRYRKLRGPQVMPDGTIKYETFFGRNVEHGTLEELNKIFKEATGTDIKFFETDVATVMESYAYSMAKMHGREAFVRRLMEYGDSAAAKLLDKTIPDPALRASTKKILDDLLAVRETRRAALGRKMTGLRDTLKRGVKDAEDIVNGVFRQQTMNQRAVQRVSARIADLEENVRRLKTAAEAVAVERRGEFDLLHAAMLTDLNNLRAAMANGTAELDEILLNLQTTYKAMYPHSVRVPDDIDVLADRIMTARGVPAAREVRAINGELRRIRAELEALEAGTPEYAALQAEVARLKDLDNGYRIMAEYRAAQDYAPDNGFLFTTGRELAMDENQTPFKALRTSAAGDDPADVIAVRVLGNDEVLDFRTSTGMNQLFGDAAFGDSLVDQLRFLGVDTEPLETGLDMVRVGLPIDPEFEAAYPEIADMLKLMAGIRAQEVLPYGDAGLVKSFYDNYTDLMEGLLLRMSVDNADLVARQVVDGALGGVVQKASDEGFAQGAVLPASLFDEAAEADDVVVIMAPNWSVTPTDSLTGPVQRASSPLIDAIIRSDADTAAQAAKRQLAEMNARAAEIGDTTAALQQEVARLTRRKGGLKSAATRRKNAAIAAQEKAGQVRNAPREIVLGGTTRQMTLKEIDTNLNALTATEQRLRANMERSLRAEQAALREGGLTTAGTQAKLAANTDRLRVLFDEGLALHTWDNGTGMVIREEIAAAIDAIASMPPTGVAGEAVNNWLSRVQRAVDSTTIIQDPATRLAYERLTQQVAFAEWNLAMVDDGVDAYTRLLDDIDEGRLGGIVAPMGDRILEGWEAIAGLGVQVPEEILNVWKPNIMKMLDKAGKKKWSFGLHWLNRLFKAWAIGTPGFVIRNLYSALFMNTVAGVSAEAMDEGFKAMWYYHKFGPEKWLDELGVVGPQRQQYKDALRAVEAAGGSRGFFSEFAEPLVRGTRREKIAAGLVDNPYTKTIRGANSRVEDHVRFPLALQALKDGDDYVGAVQRVTRYHFDYSDLSQVDEWALKVIPFWIWTTRNIPTQIANQWMRPQVYSFYQNLQDSLPTDDKTLMPRWLREYEPMGLVRFGLGGNVLLRPDMPNQRLVKTLNDLLTPKRLAGQFYPLVKVPIELALGADENLALGTPFSTEPRKAVGIDRVTAELLQLVGLGERFAPTDPITGEQQILEFGSYAAGNFVPLLAQLQRLSGGKLGGKESYDDNQLNAIATFFGVPLYVVSEYQQGSEAKGRQFKIRDFVTHLKERGYLVPTDWTNKIIENTTTRRIQERKNIERRAEQDAKRAEAKRKQAALRKASLNAIEQQYGKNSKEYKDLKARFAAEDAAAKKAARQQDIEENPIQVAP